MSGTTPPHRDSRTASDNVVSDDFSNWITCEATDATAFELALVQPFALSE